MDPDDLLGQSPNKNRPTATRIVTIDGPAGAGKSSAARALARCLSFEFLDTGAMYRAVALAAIRIGVDLEDRSALASLIGRIDLRMSEGHVILGGEDVSGLIRTPEVTAGSSVVASCSVVRQHLVELQRQIAEGRSMVCEGRDQGTVVFPHAICKFFLTADSEERLKRRARELQQRGQAVDIDTLRREQAIRDERDSKRTVAPLIPADDAVQLDSTHLSLEEVTAQMEAVVRQRLSSFGATSHS